MKIMLTDADDKDLIITCIECNKKSHASEWEEDLFDCEACGGHPHSKCPVCGEWIDGLYEVDVAKLLFV